MKPVSLAAALIAFGLSAQAASAQLPQLSKADEKAILCISEGLTHEESVAVAYAEVNGDEDAVDIAEAAILKGGAACKATLRNDERRIELAGKVAIEQAIIDLAVVQLKADGMKNGGGIFDVWGKLSRKDQDYFLVDNAPDDQAFRVRMQPLLVKAGVPDKEQDIDGGLLVMECLSNMAAYYRTWIALDADTAQ
jgi:hypothetical protein